MFKSYLKIALRNLARNKTFSVVNILGLSIGMTACILIMQYVRFELSYDDFHQAGQDIYRVEYEYIRNGEQILDSAENFAAVGGTLKEELDEVVESARLYNAGAKFNCLLTYDSPDGEPVTFKEKRFLYADASFLTLFSFPLVQGNPETALLEPNTAVLSESAAWRYFAETDAMGKVLRMSDDAQHEESAVITGVFKDVPENSHLKFDILFSFKTLHGRRGGVARYENSWWGRDNFYTYVLLAPGSDPKSVESKLPAIIDKHKARLMEVDEQGRRIRRNIFTLQALQGIHLHSDLVDNPELGGNANAVYFLMAIAVIILVIAWVNYVNLSTARSLERAREIGVRKAVGASRAQLIKQFLFESFLINICAALIAVGLVESVMPFFHLFTGKDVSYSIWSSGTVWLSLAGLFLLGAAFSGLYPAFVLSGFRPISVLKGNTFETGGSHPRLRQGLVVFQFAASVVFIAGTLTVNEQLSFMRTQDLGFNPEQILVIEKPVLDIQDAEMRTQKLAVFKTELLKYASIKAVTSSNTIPGRPAESGLFVTRKRSQDVNEGRSIPQIHIDEDFFDVYEMRLLNGRKLSEKVASDDSSVVLNESAARLLGFSNQEDVVGGQVFLFGQESHRVIGVLNDYHHESLKKVYSPAIFKRQDKRHDFYIRYFSVKLASVNLGESIATIEAIWQEVFPGNPFEHFFFDRFFDEQYRADQRFGRVFGVFTVLAIFIACLGLLGLSSYTAVQRTKEIGVRKVLGASVTHILALLSKDFTKLVLLGAFVASPLIYYGTERWLQDFAFRIQIGWPVFVVPALTVMAIALLTIGLQTIKTARANPVEALRYE